jgi:hypothetical protein
VRLRAAAAPEHLDEAARAALLADPRPEIQAAAAAAVAESRRVMHPEDLPAYHCHGFWAVLQRPLSRALLDRVLAGGDEDALSFVGPNPSTPPDVVHTLLRHPAADIRRRVAERADLSTGQLLRLAADPDVTVRTAVSVHPGLTEEQRAGIDIDVTLAADHGHFGPRQRCPSRLRRHLFDQRPPAAADAVVWARSVNPLLRRRAARSAALPPDLVAALAEDADLGVRVLLAQHHPLAPPALLLRSMLEYHGCGRERLSELPQFPTGGLARFAAHDDPAVRRLAALDPGAGPGLLERLCADADPAVRQAAASCPRLPVARITALLDEPDLAEHAAANPALPVGWMERIVRYTTEGTGMCG